MIKVNNIANTCGKDFKVLVLKNLELQNKTQETKIC